MKTDKQLSIDDIELTQPDRYNFRNKSCYEIQEGFTVKTTDNIYPISVYYESNILKYLYRYPMKNGIEDLKKAKVYIDKLIELLDKKTEDGIPLPWEDER